MAEALIAPSFLFRYSIPLLRKDPIWSVKGPVLEEEYVLPAISQLDERAPFAEVRAGWDAAGLSFSVRVEGKSQPPWCRSNRLEDSDGLHVWIDTRDTRNIHRAGRFCHHFVFLPTGDGPRLDQPVAEQMLINRARENAKPVRPGMLKVRSEKRVDGYLLEAHVPAAALTGFEPADHPRLGFCYAVVDRQIGVQTLHIGREFPFQEDPSLWCTVELVK